MKDNHLSITKSYYQWACESLLHLSKFAFNKNKKLCLDDIAKRDVVSIKRFSFNPFENSIGKHIFLMCTSNQFVVILSQVIYANIQTPITFLSHKFVWFYERAQLIAIIVLIGILESYSEYYQTCYMEPFAKLFKSFTFSPGSIMIWLLGYMSVFMEFLLVKVAFS